MTDGLDHDAVAARPCWPEPGASLPQGARGPAGARAETLERLWRLRSRVQRFVSRRLAVRGVIAEDVVSDVYLVVWRRLDDAPADTEQAFRWICGISRRVAANEWRATRRRAALATTLASCVDVIHPDVPASDADRVVALDAWHRLAGSDQEILLLVGLQGLSPSDLASILGCSTPAVLTRVSRARARLTDNLG